MTQELLAYLSSEFSEEDAAALASVVGGLEHARRWSRLAPRLVDETDSSSCTHPQDRPVRTLGAILTVSSPGEVPETPVSEPQCFLDALAVYSRERQIELEVQLDNTYVGTIQPVGLDRLLRQGLLDSW